MGRPARARRAALEPTPRRSGAHRRRPAARRHSPFESSLRPPEQRPALCTACSDRKDGLLAEALARDAFEFLYTEIAKLEESDDPVADLIDVGVLVFRRLVREHPVLYRIAFQRIVPGLDAGPELTATRQRAWNQLVAKVERLEPAGLLGSKAAPEAARRVQRHDGGAVECGAARGRAEAARQRATRRMPGDAPSEPWCGDSGPRNTKGRRCRPFVVRSEKATSI